jgi:hypothetical protein
VCRLGAGNFPNILPANDQDLPCIASLQHAFTEAPENIEEPARLATAHLLESVLKTVGRDISWIEPGSVRRLKELPMKLPRIAAA